MTANLASFPHIKAIDFSCNELDEIEQFENTVVQEFYKALITRRRQRLEEEVVSQYQPAAKEAILKKPAAQLDLNELHVLKYLVTFTEWLVQPRIIRLPNITLQPFFPSPHAQPVNRLLTLYDSLIEEAVSYKGKQGIGFDPSQQFVPQQVQVA